MRCHDPVGVKFLCTVDDDVVAYQWTKNLAYGTCITQDYLMKISCSKIASNKMVKIHLLYPFNICHINYMKPH